MGIALLVGSGWWPGSLGLTASVAAGALLGAPTFAASGIVLAALAAFFVLSGRPLGHGLAVVLATVAPPARRREHCPGRRAGGGRRRTIGWATIVRAGLLTATSVEESLALSGCSVLPIVTGAAVTSVSAPASSVIAAAAALAWLPASSSIAPPIAGPIRGSAGSHAGPPSPACGSAGRSPRRSSRRCRPR